jgi:hypothetical protein
MHLKQHCQALLLKDRMHRRDAVIVVSTCDRVTFDPWRGCCYLEHRNLRMHYYAISTDRLFVVREQMQKVSALQFTREHVTSPFTQSASLTRRCSKPFDEASEVPITTERTDFSPKKFSIVQQALIGRQPRKLPFHARLPHDDRPRTKIAAHMTLVNTV